MKLIKYSAKLYFKNTFLSVLTALFFSAVIIYIGINYTGNFQFGGLPLTYLGRIIDISTLFFAFFLFVSCEYFSKARSSCVSEFIGSTKKGKSKLYLSQLSVISSLAFALTIILTAINVAVYFFLKIGHVEYLWHILGNMAVNVLLVSLVAIVLGLVFSQIKKRLTCYMLMLFLIFLASPVGGTVADSILMAGGANIFPFIDVFAILPINDTYYVGSFGFSLLPARLAVVFFWLFGSLALAFFLKCLWKKPANIVAGTLCLSITVGCGVVYFQPASSFRMDHHATKGVFANQLYYRENNQQKDVLADFSAQAYDLELKVGNQLYATVTVSVDKENLPSYRFTLFHGFKVKSATNQSGTPLDFHQDSDYLTVDSKGSTEKITLTYSGNGSKYYSNQQGVMLPGFFPYYPIPGFQLVFDTSHQSLLKVPLSNTADFHLQVNSNQKVYTNLEMQNDGSFKGTTDALTVVSGMLDEITVGNTRVVYPYLDTTDANPELIQEIVSDFLEKTGTANKLKNIFIFSEMNETLYGTACEYSDHLTLVNLPGLERNYEQQKTLPRKIQLYLSLGTYERNPEPFLDSASWIKQNLKPGEEDLAVLIAEKSQLIGREPFIAKCKEYLANDSDTRTPSEFIKELQ